MLPYRKTYEVTGYAPPSGAYIMCPECHAATYGACKTGNCECYRVTLGSETESVNICDCCGEKIEQTLIGEDS